VRPALPLAAASLVLVPALAAGQAAEHGVRATADNSFTPATLTVTAGDTVVWRNEGGIHNVKFEDGSFDQPATPREPGDWPADGVRRTFNEPGELKYYCEFHSFPGGDAMNGVVRVVAASAPSATATASPTPAPTATPRAPSYALPGSFRARVARARFCRRCRPALVVEVFGTRTLRLAVVVKRGKGIARAFTLKARPGRRTYRIKRLPRGRYSLTLRRADGQASRQTVRFRVA
jgi:plastocyanin